MKEYNFNFIQNYLIFYKLFLVKLFCGKTFLGFYFAFASKYAFYFLKNIISIFTPLFHFLRDLVKLF